MIFSDDGIKLARTVVRVPEMEKWDKSALAGVRPAPHSLHVTQEAEVIFKEKTEIDKQIPDINLGNARQVYLRAADSRNMV